MEGYQCQKSTLCNKLWKVISVKSLLYVINVVIKKNAVSIQKESRYATGSSFVTMVTYITRHQSTNCHATSCLPLCWYRTLS